MSSITVWHADHRSGIAGPDPQQDWVNFVQAEGAAITETGDKPWNHHMIGVGVGHDDARFAESGGTEGSMAAYYENGEAFAGRWWEDTSNIGSRYYGQEG